MAIIYFSNNSHTQVTNVLGREAKAYWFSPRDDITEGVDQFSIDESRTMAPPVKWEDAILVLKAIE